MPSVVTPAHTGVWTNWELGYVKGATLTISTQHGFYLVAFLAIFVGILSSHFWSILSYVIFQFRSTVAPQDGQHHQHQAIFRNYSTPDSALWQFLNLAWAWQGKKGLGALTALHWALLALLHFLAFTIAGIMSARVSLVTDNESEVLIAGSTCGLWEPPLSWTDDDPTTLQSRAAFLSGLAYDFSTASTMAILCNNNSSDSGDCTSYAPERIKWSMIPNVSCPFKSKMCVENKTVKFDSGLIDSHAHLGINSPQAGRFGLRIVTQCAPLTRDGFMQDWHTLPVLNFTMADSLDPIQTQEGEKFIEFFYGPNYGLKLNSTFIFSNTTPSFRWGDKLYLEGVRSILGFPGNCEFSPIPGLNRTDADIDLLFLVQDHVAYTGPVDDPWFRTDTESSLRYYSKYPVSVVGCACQYQICTSRTACTPLTGMDASFQRVRDISPNPKQEVGLKRMKQVLAYTGDMWSLASALSGKALLVSHWGPGAKHPPPSDQWIQELNHMFGTSMAMLQIWNYRYAGGYDAQFTPQVTPPAKNETWMCSNQIVRRSDYQSFSILGIAIIIGTGVFIILVNLTLSRMVGRIQKYCHKREHGYLEWNLLKTETLQRIAYGAHGVDLLSGLHGIQPVLDSACAGVHNESPQCWNAWWTSKPSIREKAGVEMIELESLSDDRDKPAPN